jgi:aminoglycoside phosphotransferase (APT) family kinase protein
VADEIRHNRCRPYLKETIQSGRATSVTKLTIGTKGEDERRYRLVLRRAVDAKHFEGLRRRATIMEVLHESGFAAGQYRVPAVLFVDKRDRLVIEQGMRGNCLSSVLSTASREAGAEVYAMSARWLATLHRKALHVTGTDETVAKELSRFESYRSNARRVNTSLSSSITRLIDLVKAGEERIFADSAGAMVQCHGDFQPQNILVGQDRSRDHTTLYVAAIDFGSSYAFPPTFDLAYFLAQFTYQFREKPRVLERYGEEDFVAEYLGEYRRKPSKAFREQIDLFRIRANLSIVNFLILVGKGESTDVMELMRESMRVTEKLTQDTE